MAKITLDAYRIQHKCKSYIDLVKRIENDIAKEKLQPIKASGLNGKSPALYNAYFIKEQAIDEAFYSNELHYDLSPMINTTYYVSNLKTYLKERDYVLKLSQFLQTNKEALLTKVSLNERSFEIFQEEKFLNQKGKTILKHCGFQIEDLNVYHTSVPLTYYSSNHNTPQTILILENMDPFFSMRFLMLDGVTTILGKQIDTIIYGAGKGIIRSFNDFDFCLEDYLTNPNNTIYYWGDLDYEGIEIYESLQQSFLDHYTIQPFIEAYLAMLEKGDGMHLPTTKEGQRQIDGETFFSYFDKTQVERMKEILEKRTYIPQEILNCNDYRGEL